jgi:competence protein ComEC
MFGARIIAEITDQKDRLFLWLPVAFGLGIILYFCLKMEPGVGISLAPMAALSPALYWAWKKHFNGTCEFLTYVFLVGMVMGSAGFAAAKMSTEIYGTPILKKPLRMANIAGVIDSIESLGNGDGSRAVIRDVTIEKIPAERTPEKIRIRIRKDEGLKAGQHITLLGNFSPTSPPVAPGTYDFQRHLFYEGIGGVGFAYTQPKILEPASSNFIGSFFENLRAKIYQSVNENAGPVTAGIMTALITGQRGAIAEEDNEAMRASGLYHLLSISGSHVGMVSALLFFVSRFLMAGVPWLALHYPIKKIAAGIALCGAVFYCLLAGADVPAQRAAMMSGLVLVAIMLDRSALSLRLIAFAALVVLILIPQSLIGVSFQMSFAAVAGLICFYDYIAPVWTRLYSRAGFVRKMILYMIGLIFTSVIAGTLTGIFSLYHFQQFAVYGVLSNMIAVPLTGIVIMPAAVMALILMPFGIEHWAFQAMEWGTIWMLAVAHWTAGFDGAVLRSAQWPQITFLFLCAGTVLFLLWRGWIGKGLALALIIIGFAITPFYKQPDILVAQDGGLIAVRGDDGMLYVSTLRKDKFASKNWMRMAGREGQMPYTFAHKDFPHLCDEHGCRLIIKGVNVALSYDHSAWEDDCAWADVVISQVPMKKTRCGNVSGLYDFFDFKYRGAHAIYIDEHKFRAVSVAAERGNRPWTQ